MRACCKKKKFPPVKVKVKIIIGTNNKICATPFSVIYREFKISLWKLMTRQWSPVFILVWMTNSSLVSQSRLVISDHVTHLSPRGWWIINHNSHLNCNTDRVYIMVRDLCYLPRWAHCQDGPNLSQIFFSYIINLIMKTTLPEATLNNLASEGAEFNFSKFQWIINSWEIWWSGPT